MKILKCKICARKLQNFAKNRFLDHKICIDSIQQKNRIKSAKNTAKNAKKTCIFLDHCSFQDHTKMSIYLRQDPQQFDSLQFLRIGS